MMFSTFFGGLDKVPVGKVSVACRGPVLLMPEYLADQSRFSPYMSAWLAAVCRRSCRWRLPSLASVQSPAGSH